MNEQKKNKPWIFILPSSFLLSCLFIEAWLLQGPSYPTNLNKFSSIVTGNLCPFQVFDDVCSQFDVDLASDLAPLEGTENPRKQPNCKSLINKKPETTPLQQEIIATYTYILVVYSEDEQKYKFLCQLTEREKNT